MGKQKFCVLERGKGNYSTTLFTKAGKSVSKNKFEGGREIKVLQLLIFWSHIPYQNKYLLKMTLVFGIYRRFAFEWVISYNRKLIKWRMFLQIKGKQQTFWNVTFDPENWYQSLAFEWFHLFTSRFNSLQRNFIVNFSSMFYQNVSFSAEKISI